ncbi:hypothetical protein [Aquincola sp. J276]|uniref:hypothetical protein n=1 Tax=Aquincola sp. J276 TaxID=2898432 RepID=UPI0021507C26|nr:hypothetical protein [Aquincola sp. J276]MCR5868132.1 hypothetical protein [Aquincola sp. J276]
MHHLQALLDGGTAGQGGGQSRRLEADDGHQHHHDAVLEAFGDDVERRTFEAALIFDSLHHSIANVGTQA